MIISNITPPQVWSASSRSLTNFGSGALTSSQIVFTSIAGGATVDLRPSAGIFAITSIAAVTGAAATAAIKIAMSDGTNSFGVASSAAAANSNVQYFSTNNNSVGMQIINTDATHAGNYEVTSILFTQ